MVSGREAILQGLAPDGGLFMPEQIPTLPPKFFKELSERSLPEIGFAVAQPFLSDDIEEPALKSLVEETLSFPVPLVTLSDRQAILELFHGPTLAFKDFGGRFLGRLVAYFLRNSNREVTVLVATSGDTGSAVAHGFYQVPGIQVVLLYPRGKVSRIQEQQLTTLGGNIQALEVDGTFDDCQRMVKQAFVDPAITDKRSLTSANSINIGRLLPQSFYYFHARALASREGRASIDEPMVFSVPSGNFGNLTAGLFARRMGLPIAKFIAATNANDVVVRYLESGVYSPQPPYYGRPPRGTHMRYPEACRSGVHDEGEDQRVERKRHRQHDGDAVEVLLHHRRSGGRRAHAPTEHVGEAAAFTRVHQHQDDQAQGQQHLGDGGKDLHGNSEGTI